MTRKHFGTDGVRGRANAHPMTAEFALSLGAAAGRFFRRDSHREHRVVIGKDTRLSGYMLENALTAGFTSTGMDVLLLGPVPTPAVGLLTPSMRADVGVMISASHNPAEDNGIKFFGPDGYKLSDAAEEEIEALLETGVALAQAGNIGRARRVDDGLYRYIERVKSSFPAGLTLEGMRVVIDCAHGAAYRAAPEVLWELGAEVIPLGVDPNGRNINDGVGSTATAAAAALIRERRADIGICLDGDADRVILLDETGAEADGDQIMALLAERWAAEERLASGTLVATVMSNLGLERFLTERGLSLLRTGVGDRYVVEAMREKGLNLGGEQSGHIVMTDYATTGDGLMAGLQFLAEMVRTGQPASALARRFEPVPQLLRNVRYAAGSAPLETEEVKSAIAEAEARLGAGGRLLIRKSGTEPLIRVMAEAEDERLMADVVNDIVGAVEAAGRSAAPEARHAAAE
jgi:phosphoglucosamine mutase